MTKNFLARQIVAHMINTLRVRGWLVEFVHDGDYRLSDGVDTTDGVINHAFSVFESMIVFCNGHHRHGVLLIPSNGIDVISDYEFSDDDDFDHIMSHHIDPFVESIEETA